MQHRRRRAALLVPALAVLLAGCGGEPSSTPTTSAEPTAGPATGTTAPGAGTGTTTGGAPGTDASSPSSGSTSVPPVAGTAEPGLDVVDTGFGATDGLGLLTVAARVRNLGDRLLPVQVTFAVVDGDQAVVGTAASSTAVIGSGDTAGVLSVVQLPPGTRVETVRAVATALPGARDDDQPEGSFAADGVRAVATEEGPVRVSGVLVSHLEDGWTQVQVAAACTDAAGALVAAGETTLAEVPAGGEVPVELLTYGAPRATVVTCELLGSLTSTSERVL